MSYPSESIDHLWIEDESRKIGKNIVPQTLHGIIRSSPIIFLDIPREARLNWLVEQYVDQDFSLIEDAVIRIGKRLGGLQAGKALEAIKAGDLHTCFEIALRYYDDTYAFGVSKRDQSTIHKLQMQEVNHRANAEAILEFAQKIKKGMHE
jgi:tRNA 2-selenouridine synthase